MNNFVVLEKDFQVLKLDLGHTKPNKDGIIKDYAKLCLFDKENAVLINVFYFNQEKYSNFIEGEFYKFKIRVSAKNDTLDFFIMD